MLVFDQLQNVDRRLRVLAIVAASGLGLLVAGLWYVQVVSSRRYQESLREQTFRAVRVPGLRGRIYDRNGLVLAENRPSYNLDLYIEELRPLFDKEFSRLRAKRKLTRQQRAELRKEARWSVVSNIVRQASAIARQPIPLTDRQFHRHHEQWPYRPLTVLENLTPPQTARFLELGSEIPGLELDVRPIRHYPGGPVAAHVTGYLIRDDLIREDDEGGYNYSLPSYQGAVGLEYAFDKDLTGKAGLKTVVVNSLCYRESEIAWTVSEPGNNVRLTVDLPLQKAAIEALRSSGANVRGAAVVMDALNGDVFVLASTPGYNPGEFVSPISEERWRGLNDPELRPMFNRATQGAYYPGSIFKIVTALSCLEKGVLTPVNVNSLFSNPGYFQLGRRRIKDLAAPGEYDFKRAFKKSSNTYFIHHGLEAGRDAILRWAHRLSLGERIGLPTRQEARGWVPTPEEVRGVWNDGNTANLCIGQEIKITPLQMAVMVAAIANGGKVLWPRLVQRVESPDPGLDDTTLVQFPARVRSDLGARPCNLEIIRQAMLADTEEEEGTGYHAFHEGGSGEPILKDFRVGGKTGTAQVADENNRIVDHITWFASFGPYESPRFVVVVMVESGASGGGTCAPIARQIYQAIQKRLNWVPATPANLARAGTSLEMNLAEMRYR